MFIPGYFGKLECPRSREFCRMETITGVKFLESNRFFELILWAIVGAATGLPLLLLFVPCLHTPLSNCCKRLCGVNKFKETDEMGNQIPSRYAIPSRCAQIVLRVISSFFMLMSLAIIGVSSWWLQGGTVSAHTVLPIMLVSIWGVIISAFGVMSSYEATPSSSCIILAYFFLQMFATLISLWASLSLLTSSDLSVFVERNWDIICNTFKDRCTPTADEETQEQEMEEFTDYAQDWMYVIGSIGVAWVIVNTVSLCAAYRLIGGKTLTATTVTTVNNVGLVLGILLSAAGIYLTVVTEMNADIGYVSGLFLASACFMVVNSPLGLYAARKKRIRLLWVHFVVTWGYILLLASASIAIFVATDEVNKQIDGFNDDRLAEIADAMQLAMSEEEMKVFIKENVRRIGISAAVLAFLQILLVVAILGYIHYTKVSRITPTFDLLILCQSKKLLFQVLQERKLKEENQKRQHKMEKGEFTGVPHIDGEIIL